MRCSLSILALTALASSCVTALGINCRGSSSCSSVYNPYVAGENVADSLCREIEARASDTRWYQNGQHIACINGVKFGHSICAFLQGTGGLPGKDIKTLAQRIVEHGCKICGSVPVYFDKGDNDVKSHGELTFNFVNRITA